MECCRNSSVDAARVHSILWYRLVQYPAYGKLLIESHVQSRGTRVVAERAHKVIRWFEIVEKLAALLRFWEF